MTQPSLIRAPFRDRSEAGRLLATKLAAYAHRPDVLVLALPRGGVPVAYKVACALGAPLDIFVVRKPLLTARRTHSRRVRAGEEETTVEQPMEGEGQDRLVRVKAGPVTLEGTLSLPVGARGVVLFAHGSGSSRHSVRNRHVARLLNEAGLATLLIDLLTADEEAIDRLTAHLRFDISLLAERLVSATEWLTQFPDTRHLRIGYFGASTGAAAALVAAADRPQEVGAIVSRGGRPDLAGPALPRVQAPTLLIVGGNDLQVIELNRMALAQLRCEKRLVIVPGATHLFEEPGALDDVARLAREWFERYLVATDARVTGVGTPQA